MPPRSLTVEGQEWSVYPSGRSTVYGQDQYGLMFQLGTGPERKRRFPPSAALPPELRAPDVGHRVTPA